MATRAVEEERIRPLNDRPVTDGRYVLYWMQQSQRVRFNPALEVAVRRANDLKAGLLVGFGLTADYPEANRRHYHFMLEGLTDVESDLRRRGIPFCAREGAPDEVALELGERAGLIVCDRGYLRHQRRWRENVAAGSACRVMEVDGDAVVPPEVVSRKAEYAARTIRPKVHEHLDRFLVELRTTPLGRDSLDLGVEGIDLSNPSAIVDRLGVDSSVPAVTRFFRGGTREAVRRMRRFRDRRLKDYAEARSRPERGAVSRLSPYLHFGQISPVEVALTLGRGHYGEEGDREAYLEELCVRRTLAQNFVWFSPKYDSYAALPGWARATLEDHRDDERPARYSKRELETARTHDRYWNAAMREMRYTGYMHNHMRMYWGKKILDWTNTPEYAYEVALELNNRYFLDGRDANSFANVGWIFGLHDRPWPEREVYGKVRTMTATGLERKTDIDTYVRRVDEFVTEARSAGIVFDDD